MPSSCRSPPRLRRAAVDLRHPPHRAATVAGRLDRRGGRRPAGRRESALRARPGARYRLVRDAGALRSLARARHARGGRRGTVGGVSVERAAARRRLDYGSACVAGPPTGSAADAACLPTRRVHATAVSDEVALVDRDVVRPARSVRRAEMVCEAQRLMRSLFAALRTDGALDPQTWIVADARIDYPETPAATDSERILQAFMQWGDRCVDHLLGDFAFAIWDGRARRLFCARDHMGVKPLYYVHARGWLLVSTSVDA